MFQSCSYIMCFTTFSIELYFMLYHVFYVGLYVKRTRAYNCIGVLRCRNNKYYYYYYYYYLLLLSHSGVQP